MQINIQVTGVKELQRDLKDFSERRVKSVVSTALTRTAVQVRKDWQDKINTVVQGPTPLTGKAVVSLGAKADKLEATVSLSKRGGSGNPSEYLRPQELGGGRNVKKFERALISAGAMPSGYITVPGSAAKLDGYGNVSRAQLVDVIRALGAQYSPGYQRVISKSTNKRLAAQARSGRQYVAVSPGEAKRLRVSAGIYERMADGSRKAIFVFKKSVTYGKRLGLLDRVSEIERTLQAEVTRAIDQSAARLAAKK